MLEVHVLDVVLGGLTCTTHFQIYVVLEVLDVVLEVYHTQHIFKYTMCVLLEVVYVLEVLPYATHFQTYVVLEVKHDLLCWRFTIHNALSKYVVCNHFLQS